MESGFTILIDGACPLCRREADLMARLDRRKGRLKIIDIAAQNFDPAQYGTTMDAIMGSIHGVTADGRVLKGMEVFRLAYSAVGWGWMLAPTGWPLLRPVFDRLYTWFAKNRLRLTRRRGQCDGGTCRV